MIRQSSLQSFIQLQDSLSERQGLIFNCVWNHGEDMTDREIADALGFQDPNAVRPRRKELVDMGLLSESDKRVCAITGKTVLTWKVSKVN